MKPDAACAGDGDCSIGTVVCCELSLIWTDLARLELARFPVMMGFAPGFTARAVSTAFANVRNGTDPGCGEAPAREAVPSNGIGLSTFPGVAFEIETALIMIVGGPFAETARSGPSQ